MTVGFRIFGPGDSTHLFVAPRRSAPSLVRGLWGIPLLPNETVARSHFRDNAVAQGSNAFNLDFETITWLQAHGGWRDCPTPLGVPMISTCEA